MAKRTSILCVAPFNNPHIVPTYDEIAAQPEADVTRVAYNPLPPARVRLGWPEMAEDSPYLQPWRRMKDRIAYWKALLRSDVVIFPGFFHFRTLPLHHWIRRLTGKPAMLWSEPFLSKWREKPSRYLLHVCLKKPCDSEKVHFLSIGPRAANDQYATGIKRWRCWLFAFGVGPAMQLGQPGIKKPDGEVHIVYVGSLRELKRVDLLLEALGTPQLVNAPWRLTLVGDGDQRGSLKATADRLGVADKITFLGNVAHERCREVLSGGDILVLPSRRDGWGAVVNEAMESGLAVICSDAVGASVLVDPGVTGFVFRSGDGEGLAGYLRQLIEDPQLLAKMQAASRERIVLYRPAEAARRLVALCRGAAGHAPMPEYTEGLCSPLYPVRRPYRELVNE